LFDFSALQEASILQYRQRNKPKSIEIIAKASSKSIFVGFLHIYNLHLTTFFLNKKRGKNFKKR